MQTAARKEIDLSEVLLGLVRHAPLILAFCVIGGAIAYMSSKGMTRKYAVAALIQVTPTGSLGAYNKIKIDPAEVLTLLDFNFSCSLASSVSKKGCIESMNLPIGSQVIRITVVSTTLDDGRAAVGEMVAFVRKKFDSHISAGLEELTRRLRSVNQEAEGLRPTIAAMERRLLDGSQERLDIPYQRDSLKRELSKLVDTQLELELANDQRDRFLLTIVDERPVSESPVQPRPTRVTMAGLGLGLALGCIFAHLRSLYRAGRSRT